MQAGGEWNRTCMHPSSLKHWWFLRPLVPGKQSRSTAHRHAHCCPFCPQAVARLPCLERLSLRGCSQLGDHHLAALFKGVSALSALNLQSCNGLTGAHNRRDACGAR